MCNPAPCPVCKRAAGSAQAERPPDSSSAPPALSQDLAPRHSLLFSKNNRHLFNSAVAGTPIPKHAPAGLGGHKGVRALGAGGSLPALLEEEAGSGSPAAHWDHGRISGSHLRPVWNAGWWAMGMGGSKTGQKPPIIFQTGRSLTETRYLTPGQTEYCRSREMPQL